MAALCKVTVNRGDSRMPIFAACDRPVSEKGKCKRHLRVDAERARKDREGVEKDRAGDRVEAHLRTLGRKLKVGAEPYYVVGRNIRGSGTSETHAVVPIAWLEQLAKKKEG